MVKISTITGWSLDTVLDFDVETFNELLESVLRNQYHEKIESAWTAMVAAQGDHKGMKKWVDQWAKVLRGGEKSAGQEAQGDNLDEFLNLFGGGF